MLFIKRLVLCSILSCLFYSSFVFAKSVDDALGYWTTYDLDKVPRSVVHFERNGDEISATIMKVITNKDSAAGAICANCEGPLKNKPLVGIKVIWGAKLNGDRWTDGYVLDTDSGTTYRCNISTSDDGKILYLHAYVAAPLFGRTVEWQRASEEDAEE